MIEDLKKIYQNRSLVLWMAYKEISDRYAGSTLGILWTIIQPMFLILLYALIFTFIFKVRIGNNDSPIFYAFYAIAGLIPWIAMSEAVAKSISAVSSKNALIKQVIFPVNILPISSILASSISLIVGFVIFFLLMLIFQPGQISVFFLLLPLVILVHIIFVTGLGYFLSMGGVYFRDLTDIVTLLLTVGMFVTPILYIEDMIPAVFMWPIKLNPFSHLIFMYRDVVFYGTIRHPWSFVIFTALSIIIFVSGFAAFKKMKHLFADVL